MASKYWLKLYHEMLDDEKVMMLRPALRWRFIETLLVAGEMDEGGYLPETRKYAWRVRDSFEVVETELGELAEAGLLSRVDGRWLVTKFAERQAAVGAAERMARMRERQKKQGYYGDDTPEKRESYEDVTKRHTDKDIDKDIDTETAPLVLAFCEALGRPAPDLRHRRALYDWLEPESAILSIVAGDVAQGRELVKATLAYMDEQGLSYKNLSSLINVARTVWNKKAQAGGNGHDPWAVIERAWKEGNARVVSEDARVFETVERMGGWLRFKNASQRDVPFLKQEFLKVYNASIPA